MSQGTDVERIPNVNITSRKKHRPRPGDKDNDSDDENFHLPSTAKKRTLLKTNNVDGRPGLGPGSLARRNLNFDGLPHEPKRVRAPAPQQNDEECVSRLMQAHFKYKNILNPNNCFEKKTVLDLINVDVIQQESMSDMAIILNSAVEVYGYRVDRCYLNAQDTRGCILSSLTGGKGVDTPNTSATNETPKKRRRDDVKQKLGDWKARLDEAGERELEIADEEEEEAEGRRHIPEEDPDRFLDDIPINLKDMDDFLGVLLNQRKNLNKKLHSNNAHLVEDNDELLDKSNKELSSNEYYQKAVSRYGEGNSLALLMNNAKVTSDAQAFLVHPRVVTTPMKIQDSMNFDFIRNIRITLANSLAPKPERPDNDLLPRLNDVLDENDFNSDDDHEPTMLDMTTAARAFNEGDVANMADRQGKSVRTKDFRRSILFRGKNLTVDRLWVRDDKNLHLADDLFNTKDKEDFTRFRNLRKQDLLHAEKGKLPPELEMSPADIRERAKFFEMAGVDEEVGELDNLWNAHIVRRTVRPEDTEEMVKNVEESEGSREEILSKKRRILAPGDYVFFMDSDPNENPLIATDNWADEGVEAIMDMSVGEVFYDALDDVEGAYDDDPVPFDEACPDNEDIPYEERVDHITEDVRAAMERPKTVPNRELILTDDVADVPVNPGMIPDAPDDAIRNMGKEDDAHWKGNKPVEAEKETRRAKKTRQVEDKIANTDNYWAPSNPASRRRALARFNHRANANIERNQGAIYQNRAITRQPYQHYDFNDFNKVACLNGKVEYEGFPFDSSLRTEDLLNKATVMQEASLLDADGKDILGIEFLRVLRGLRINFSEEAVARINAYGGIPGECLDDQADPFAEFNKQLRNSKFHPESDNEESQEENPESASEGATAVDQDEDGIGADDDFGGIPDCESNDIYHTAQDPIEDQPQHEEQHHPEDQLQPRLWTKSKNKIQELRELQAADDYEEEGEIAEGIEGKAPIIIKNTSIDQSKVKSYLKGILTTRLLDSKCLKTITEAASDMEYVRDTTVAVHEATMMGHDISVMNGSFEYKNTGIDPLEVSRIVFNPPEEQISQGTSQEDGATTSQESLKNAVVLSDFDVQGEHSLSSLMACLPYRAERSHEKNMHVALLFSVALQMCNENTLHCVQNKVDDNDDSWMSDFIFKNGASNTATTSGISVQNSRPARVRPIPDAIPEVDEDNLEDSTSL